MNKLDEGMVAPKGMYGVFCEPKFHMGNPQWTAKGEMPYQQAMEEADYMNRANHQWHYYAKPVPSHKVAP